MVRHMYLCAGLLGDQGCETLAAGLHRSLLCHLCDEALDREPLRVLLTRRMDWAENVRKDMRDAAAEDKGRIKASLACPSPVTYDGRSSSFSTQGEASGRQVQNSLRSKLLLTS